MGYRAFRLCISVVLLIIGSSNAPASAQSSDLPDSASIQSVIEGSEALQFGARVLDKKLLAAVYEPRRYEPIWTAPRRESFERALAEAASQGLDPSQYETGWAEPIGREFLLTDSFIRYARALAEGRISPASFDSGWYVALPDFDSVRTVEAATAGDVASVLAELAPQESGYKRLQEALQHYRSYAQTGWPALDRGALRPGARGAPVQRLRERLVREEYLAARASGPEASSYDRELSDAVSRFQAAHGLPVDGAADRDTLAALNISPGERVQQIVLNLERWRSLPRIQEPRRIEVNAAAAMATLYENNEPIKTTRVIVGSTTRRTPVLRAEMESVQFNPPWYVPRSIYRNELGPTIQRDPSFMARGNYVFREIDGTRQLVQLPGPKNTLGRIKFELPNPADVYLHDTPDRKLLARAKRFLSHGCVRVEDPRDLARLVLGSPNWSAAAIDAAIASGRTQRVALAQRIPVYLLYWTAFVDPDGTIEFRDDAYGRDRRLEQALAAQTSTEVAGAGGCSRG